MISVAEIRNTVAGLDWSAKTGTGELRHQNQHYMGPVKVQMNGLKERNLLYLEVLCTFLPFVFIVDLLISFGVLCISYLLCI